MKNVKHRNFVDKYGYMLEWSRDNGGDNGKGDAVARTVLAAIIYREKQFIDVIIMNFLSFLNAGLWHPMRHIESPRTHDFSRDHTIWFVIWLVYFDEIRHALRIPWRISEKFKQTIDMWLWIRAVAKDRWWDRLIYWIVASIMMRFNNRWNRFLRSRAGIKSVHYKDFQFTKKDDLTKKELYAREHCVPSYTFDTQAWMVKCLPDGWFKNRLKKRVIPLVEPTNYHIRMLMDDIFDYDELVEIKNYTGMDAQRAGRRMDKTETIPLFPLSGEQPPYNIDVDYLTANLDIS